MPYKLTNSIRLDKVYASKEIKPRIIFEKYISTFQRLCILLLISN